MGTCAPSADRFAVLFCISRAIVEAIADAPKQVVLIITNTRPGARQYDSAAYLSTACQLAVAECSDPAQSASTGAVGATYPTVEPMDSTTPGPASLSRSTGSTPLILRKSRVRKRARTDWCGGRSAMVVPTATVRRYPARFMQNRFVLAIRPILAGCASIGGKVLNSQ